MITPSEKPNQEFLLETVNSNVNFQCNTIIQQKNSNYDKENRPKTDDINTSIVQNQKPSLLSNLKAEYKKTLAKRSWHLPSGPSELSISAVINQSVQQPSSTSVAIQTNTLICEEKSAPTPQICLQKPSAPMSNSITDCSHGAVVRYRCQYCKDCGIFLPKGKVQTFRESVHKQKLNLNPDRIFAMMLSSQKRNRHYDPNAAVLKGRKILAEWICELGHDLSYSSDTIHIAVSYLDNVLSQLELPKNKMQLIALVCLYIAGKFNEIEYKAVRINDFYDFARGIYSIELLEKTELLILELLEWNIRTVTPVQFLEFFLVRGVVFGTDNLSLRAIDERLLRHVRKYATFFTDLVLQEYSFNRFDSLIVACAAIAAARKIVGLSAPWNEELTELTTVTWEQISECYKELVQFYKSSSGNTSFKDQRLSNFNSSSIFPNKRSNDLIDDNEPCEKELLRSANREKMLMEDDSSTVDNSLCLEDTPLNFNGDYAQGGTMIVSYYSNDMLLESTMRADMSNTTNNPFRLQDSLRVLVNQPIDFQSASSNGSRGTSEVGQEYYIQMQKKPQRGSLV